MFADSPFAVPRSSFERPVPLVLVDPDVAPLVCLKVNREWVPYILGALKQLVLQTTWKTDDPEALNLVQARAMLLIAMFQQALTANCDDSCVVQDLSTSLFNWQPGNPFTAPDDVPNGYHFPPWYIAPQTTLIPTIRAGDVVTDILHAPYNPLPSGFPRFRLTVDGPGTVEIKFVRFPTASIALWTVDGNIATTQWTDLHVSLEAAIGRFDPEMIIPISVTGPGQHVLDVSIVPSITEEPPFVHFGGAIRSVSLCGFGSEEKTFIPVDELEYIMSVCEQLRFHNGKLQGLCCGEWSDIAGQGDIIIGGPDQPGGNPPQPQPQPGGGCQSYKLKFSARDQALVPTVVSAGDVITFSNAKGAGTDGTGIWNCPDGPQFFAGACIGAATSTDPADPAPTQNHMAFVALINGTWYPAYNGSVTVPAGVSNAPITVQVNDSSLADNSGDYTLDVEVCNNSTPGGSWCIEWNFALSPYEWAFYSCGGSPSGFWQASQGMTGSYCNESGVDGTSLAFHIDLPTGTAIDTIRIVRHTSNDGSEGGHEIVFGGITRALPRGTGDFDETYNFNTTGNAIIVDDSSNHTGTGVNNYVTRITAHGTGTRPSLGVNC